MEREREREREEEGGERGRETGEGRGRDRERKVRGAVRRCRDGKETGGAAAAALNGKPWVCVSWGTLLPLRRVLFSAGDTMLLNRTKQANHNGYNNYRLTLEDRIL